MRADARRSSRSCWTGTSANAREQPEEQGRGGGDGGARGGVGSGPPRPGARDREPRADDRSARFVASEHGSHPGDDESYTDA